MIEDNKTVKSIESKIGGKSGTYWKVTWTDDKADNIFNEDWLPLLERSQNENSPLHFTKEKSENSKYYNIKSLELLAPEPTPKQTTKPEIAPQEKSEMSKKDWSEKDKITRTSIERQKALELAVNWAIALLNSSSFTKKESLTTRNIMVAAKEFEQHLATGEVPEKPLVKGVEGKEILPKSRLVEEARKLGGKVIDEGQSEVT